MLTVKASIGWTGFVMGWLVASVFALSTDRTWGEDYYLTIAGGYSPEANQVSLEKNVIYFQRILHRQLSAKSDVFFADGHSDKPTLQVVDASQVPKANRLMAEFFGSQDDLGLYYRPHKLQDILGKTSPENINRWFHDAQQRFQPGDRLFLYVTAHGGKSTDDGNEHDTSIYLWNRKKLRVSEFVRRLNQLPEGVTVITVMVQCHAGGFARMIYNGADPRRGINSQMRCGFFATVHDRAAAGCTSDIDEANYEEYSTYFWAALVGKTRDGESIEMPDYDGDGQVSFAEAHAYAVLHADTIDLPIKTSGEFLRNASRFGSERDRRLLPKNANYGTVLQLAGPVERAVLEGLSEQLGLSGDERIVAARERISGSKRRGRERTRAGQARRDARHLRRSIANDLEERWPQLNNLLNPTSIELLTERSKQFIQAVEGHPKYSQYRKLSEEAEGQLSRTESRVKFERFIRVAENVVLAANLEHVGSQSERQHYARLITCENGHLQNPKQPLQIDSSE